MWLSSGKFGIWEKQFRKGRSVFSFCSPPPLPLLLVTPSLLFSALSTYLSVVANKTGKRSTLRLLDCREEVRRKGERKGSENTPTRSVPVRWCFVIKRQTRTLSLDFDKIKKKKKTFPNKNFWTIATVTSFGKTCFCCHSYRSKESEISDRSSRSGRHGNQSRFDVTCLSNWNCLSNTFFFFPLSPPRVARPPHLVPSFSGLSPT